MLERFKTLRGKFLCVLLIPVVIATVIVTAVFGVQFFIDLKNDVLAKKEIIAAHNADLLRAPLWNFDPSHVERMAASIAADADVASVIVRNDQGEIIARVGGPKGELVVQQDIAHIGLNKTYMLGQLEITFHMERIHGAITRQIVQNALLLLSLVVVILVSAVFANRWIVDRPLGRLLGAIRLAEERGSRGPVKWRSQDEIGAVIAAFNAMQEKLGAEERNLRISEARLVDAQRIAKLGNWNWDIGNDELSWSDETCRIFGWEPQSFGATYGAFLETVHPEDRANVEEGVRKALAQEAPYMVDYRIVLPGGGERFVHGEGEVALDGAGKPVHMLGTVQDITERKRAETALDAHRRLAAAIGEIQSQYISESDKRGVFDRVLTTVLGLTESEYGFIGEILHTDEGSPYLKTYALSNISWNEETRRFFDDNAPKGMIFANLDTLFGAVMRTAQPVIANDPANDPRSGGLPEGHPPLNAFLGIPIVKGEKLVGMMGIANRPNGYDQDVIDHLRPLSETCSNIIESLGVEEERRKLLRAIEQSPVSVVITDTDAKIEYVNPKFTEITGYARDEVIGLNPRILQSGNMPKKIYDDLWRAIAAGGEWQGELHNKKKNGELFWESATISALTTPDGTITHYIGVKEDITERRQAEQAKRESEGRLRAVIDNAPAIVHLKDHEGRFRIVNKEFERFYGMPADAALGKTAADLFPGALADTYSSLDQSVRETGDVITREIETPQHDGALRILRSIRFPVFGQDGRTTGIGVVALDVTERQRAHEELARAKVAAETANQAKSEFLSSMSHELRTPMNAILGFGQMLEFNREEPLTETQKEYVGYILKGGQHLLELINDVLDLAKIEAGKAELSIEDVCTKTVLDECLALIHAMADERGIEIFVGESFKTAAKIRADQTRFKQSLLNLMSNAVKYNREKGKIELHCHETPGGMLQVSVTDTGEGITEDKLGELFKPFQRLTAEYTEIEGTGIGLTITKRLVEGMGGRIGVDSEVGKGSTFWIELPLAKRTLLDAATVGQGGTKDVAESGPDVMGTVLYVEDSPANLHLMEQIIKRVTGLSMISAHTAELGIELAKINNTDLIILDINLPGMDGFEALRALQSIEETRGIPVIALSANAMPKDIQKGIEAGFQRYLTKPIKVEEVVSTIKDVLQC